MIVVSKKLAMRSIERISLRISGSVGHSIGRNPFVMMSPSIRKKIRRVDRILQRVFRQQFQGLTATIRGDQISPCPQHRHCRWTKPETFSRSKSSRKWISESGSGGIPTPLSAIGELTCFLEGL